MSAPKLVNRLRDRTEGIIQTIFSADIAPIKLSPESYYGWNRISGPQKNTGEGSKITGAAV